jgi:DNA invertase Pin-like site-specific DNA recombinase
MNMQATKSIVTYYRVSTRKQGESGLGLDAQRTTVDRFKVAEQCSVLAEFTEIESGKKSTRPELLKAIALAKAQGATLVVAKLDRLARNVAFTSALMDAGVDFVACDMPSANRLTIHIMAAMAEDEARRISTRTRDALAELKAQGVKLGSARPGHWAGREHLRGWGGSKNKDAILATRFRQTYAAVLPVVETLVDRNESAAGIAQALNARGFKTPRGSKFCATSVGRILEKLK